MMGVQGAVDAAEAETPGGGGNGVPAAMAPSGATSPGAALSGAALPGAAPTDAPGLAERGGLTPDRVEIIGGVHVEIYGAGAGAGPGLPVLAVHGFMSSRTQWMLNLPALVAARPVAVVELLGHGRSEAPEALSDYAPARYFETFETIRGLMGAPRWHLCGQSFGAAMTLRYQDAHPDVVAAQVFTNSTASFADPATPEAAALARERAERIRAEGREGLSAHRSHPSGARRFPAAVKAAMLEDAARLDPHARDLSAKKSRRNMSTAVFSDISLMSAPAAKAFSEPVTTMQRTRSSASNFIRASFSSPRSSWFSAFSASGRLSLTSPTWSRVSTIRLA